jgi:hypothetical protein
MMLVDVEISTFAMMRSPSTSDSSNNVMALDRHQMKAPNIIPSFGPLLEVEISNLKAPMLKSCKSGYINAFICLQPWKLPR